MLKFILGMFCIVWIAKHPELAIAIVVRLATIAFAIISFAALLLLKAVECIVKVVIP